MDVGLDRLIEMFEERFGKRAATALLLLMGLGVGAWAIHSVISLIILPTAKVVGPWLQDAPPKISTPDLMRSLIAGVVSGLLGLLGWWLFVKVLVHRIYRRFERNAELTRESIHDLWAAIQKAHGELQHMVDVARAYGIEVERPEDLGPIGSPNRNAGELPSPQSHEGTEEGKPQ